MPPSPAPRKGRPPRVSRAEIVQVARRVMDEEGGDRLTMRRLARELEITPMALYHHVRDKEELMLLLLADYAAGAELPELPGDPRERIVVAARAMHDLLAARPRAVEMITADDLLAPVGLWFAETIVDAAVACGLTPERAVRAYRTIWFYTAGELTVRAAGERRRAERAGEPTYRERVFAGLDGDAYPRLAGLAGRWVEITAEDSYEEGLRAVVAGLLP
ncbi:TetR/AcrR family transcriptional regulator [Actinomadura hibisca]|uniref:TetR/AcrR family transcriptional regulator n=1 Tax=Actinomadura hibisca TaxID=68565 RepID=UPI0008313EBE|nr:TetR family transcriptional regulator [Actinomadura hibisca]